ncbi:MAG: endonuclease [Candidatus Aenigmarchaeota archaeon]|nr:endonuclease [Candidatus Aenigmarchaeota archaeon]
MDDIEIFLMFSSLLLAAVCFLLYLHARSTAKRVEQSLRDTTSQKQSLSTKYGKMSEQFMPFLKEYPYDPNQFRFIGSPIDGIQFEQDKIIFVEFKTNTSALTQRQKEIQSAVKKGHIEFLEFRIRD